MNFKLKFFNKPFPLMLALLAMAAVAAYYFDLPEILNIEAAANQSGTPENPTSDVRQNKSDEQRSESAAAIGKNDREPSRTSLPESAASTKGLTLVRNSFLLLREKSFKANIRQRAFLFDKEVTSTGTYLQADGGSGGVRMELDIKTEHLDLHVRTFNDGVYFFRETESNHTAQQDNSSRDAISSIPANRIESIDLRKINERHANDVQWPGQWIAFGGLYLFMEQMQNCFNFSVPKQTTIGTMHVNVTQGTWKPEKLALLLPEQKETILTSATVNLSRIPPQIPVEVELYFLANGPEKNLPIRIVFYRPDGQMQNGGNRIPILVTDFVDSKLIDTPATNEFQFNARNNEVFDVTNQFLTEFRK